MFVQGSGRVDCKSAVVNALGAKRFESLRGLHSFLSKEFSSKWTYQAVHKATGELIALGVVEKGREGYSLSEDWIKKESQWLESALTLYSGESPPVLTQIAEGASVSHTFTGVISVPYWTLKELPPLAAGKSKTILLCSFAWPAQMVGEEQHKQLKLYNESLGNYVLCRGKDPGDIYCLKYLEQALNAKWKAGVDVASECDTIATNEFVINIYWPTSHKKLMRKAYSSKSIPEAMKAAYDYVFYGEGPKLKIPVVITRNKTIARQVIEETISLFKH